MTNSSRDAESAHGNTIGHRLSRRWRQRTISSGWSGGLCSRSSPASLPPS